MNGSKLLVSLLATALVPVGAAAAQETRQCSPEDVSVRFRLSEGSYRRDEPVRMRLRAENTSSTACEMQFPSGRPGTVRVIDDRRVVWEQGYCRVYTQHIELETWEPGHHESWGFRWKQRFNVRGENGRLECGDERPRADPGGYDAHGIFFGTDADIKTAPSGFRITN